MRLPEGQVRTDEVRDWKGVHLLELRTVPPAEDGLYAGDPNEIRTRVTGVRGRCPNH